jgi:hypothetical protein
VLAVDRDVVETVVPVRRCLGLPELWAVVASSSEGELEHGCEFKGGDSSVLVAYTRAQGALVRSVGAVSVLESTLARLGLSGLSCLRGRVSAQFSHGPARLVTS